MVGNREEVRVAGDSYFNQVPPKCKSEGLPLMAPGLGFLNLSVEGTCSNHCAVKG